MKIKFGSDLVRSVKKLFEDDLIAGHHLHWVCLAAILVVSFAGNCYQIYHAVQDMSKNVSDIDITYPENYSVPSITVCFPVIALLNTECLRRQKPAVIRKFEAKYPEHRGRNLLKELYSEIIKSEDQIRIVLDEFFVGELYACLEKPGIEMVNDNFSVLAVQSVRESFKSDLFCLTLNFDKPLVNKYQLLKKRILKNFFELTMSLEELRYVDYIKFFLHDPEDHQNDYLLWYFKLIKFDFNEKEPKNAFGFSYLHYSNILEEGCTPNGHISYHYTEEKFSTTSHMEEDCVNRDFISILRYPYGDTRLPVEFIRENPKLKVKLYKPDKPSFVRLNNLHNFTRLIDNCFQMATQKSCITSIFVPELRYSFRKDKNPNVTFILIPPGEPDLEVKSAPQLSTFEFGVFIMSVICCWLQFSMFGFVYSLIVIKKNLDEIEHNFCYRKTDEKQV